MEHSPVWWKLVLTVDDGLLSGVSMAPVVFNLSTSSKVYYTGWLTSYRPPPGHHVSHTQSCGQLILAIETVGGVGRPRTGESTRTQGIGHACLKT